jgi:thiamine kinase-like enzyme
MGAMGLAPASLLSGTLEAGISILVQEKIEGHLPTRKDFRDYLPQFAEILRQTHQSERLKQALPSKASQGYREAGLETLEQIALRWESYKSRVTASADFVDQSLAALRVQLDQFQGAGLVASHNDVCNGNWLVSREGRVYLLDYESMSLDDPALDLGAILWWYYPPPLWEEFLARAGYAADQDLRRRMQVRMALHCLNILLPRAQSFDRFDPSQFDADLVDFRAALAGQANPQGYDD